MLISFTVNGWATVTFLFARTDQKGTRHWWWFPGQPHPIHLNALRLRLQSFRVRKRYAMSTTCFRWSIAPATSWAMVDIEGEILANLQKSVRSRHAEPDVEQHVWNMRHVLPVLRYDKDAILTILHHHCLSALDGQSNSKAGSAIWCRDCSWPHYFVPSRSTQENVVKVTCHVSLWQHPSSTGIRNRLT